MHVRMKTCFIKVSLLSQGRAENLIRGHAKKQLKLTAYYLTNACLLALNSNFLSANYVGRAWLRLENIWQLLQNCLVFIF